LGNKTSVGFVQQPFGVMAGDALRINICGVNRHLRQASNRSGNIRPTAETDKNFKIDLKNLN